MSSTIQSLIEARISANAFDPARELTDAQITDLVRLATRAPSAFNYQNWRFIAVKSAEAKARLKAAAYNQPKVGDASVTFIVCGTLNAHLGLAAALKPSVDAGIIPQAMADGWVGMAASGYGVNPAAQRDEAIRSASLASMTLMLAAQGMGLVTGPMIGFDPAAVAREFGLGANDVPAMLITVGYAAAGNWPQKPRRAVADVLSIV